MCLQPGPAVDSWGTSWGAVDGAAAAHHICPFLLHLVSISFVSWICISCTHFNEAQTSLASWHYFLLDCLQYPSIAAETLHLFHPAARLHQTSGYFLMSAVQQMIMAWHRQLQDLPQTLFVAVQILALISFMWAAKQFCFYSNSGHTEFPFASVVINLSLLISCIPQAFQQGGLKAESCIVDWMHSLSSKAITNQSL